MSKFQIILLAVFIVLAVIGVFIFATSTSNSSAQLVPVTIWGTLPATDVRTAIDDIEAANKDTFSATYTYVDEADFQSKLVNAIATGQGPDLILIPQDIFLSVKSLLFPIPYANYSQRLFQDSFAQAGEVFLAPEGIYALPAAIDPLVMFWNRDILSTAGLALPPSTWTNVVNDVPALTKKDANGNIVQSAVSFGEWTNVPHAKNILSMLMLQSGTPIVSADPTTGKLVSALLSQSSSGISPAQEALSFFTQFADPSKSIYSWNRAKSSADSAFLAGTLAFYFAPASETPIIRARNPNLNFDVAEVPQTGTTGQATYADVYAFGLLKSSPHLATDVIDANLLTSDTAVSDIAAAAAVAPSRRDLLAQTQSQAYQAVFWQSALIGDNFLDPSPSSTDTIFDMMVESVTSGSKSAEGSLRTADGSLAALLRQVAQ
jgi:ABC-type glycerol-3-phosphate transport system substrate-binding protein